MADEKISIHTSYERIDNRRARKYGQRCTVSAYTPSCTMPAWHRGLTAFGVFREAVLKHCPGALLADAWGHSGWCIRWSIVAEAPKPSSIPTEAEARALLPDDAALLAMATAAYEETSRICTARTTAHEAYRHAAALLRSCLSRCEKSAAESIGLAERLAALGAEFKAAVATHAPNMIEEMYQSALKGDCPKEGAERFKQFASVYIYTHASSDIHRGFPRCEPDLDALAASLYENDNSK